MLPQGFPERMLHLLGEAEFAEFLASYERPRSAGLRLNPRKPLPEGVTLPFCEAQVPWEPNGYYVCEGSRPGLHPWHDAGAYYLQEPSAMAPARLLDAQPGERVLDLCAAPGGKTTQLAAAMQGRGLLVCNEIHPRRAQVLASNIERLGIPNALVLSEHPAKLAQRFPGYFDRILVDAPCSGEGMFRKEEAAVTDWSEATVAMCAARLGDPERAVEYLLDYPAFDFDPHGLVGGGRAPFPYFPGNGGLLYAVAMMAAGWDGAPAGDAPGFPEKGWVVRSEGLRRAL